MRTAIDLPDHLYKQVQALARDTGRPLGQTTVDLIRHGLAARRSTTFSTDPRTGLPLVSIGTAVTFADVRSLDDEGDG
jgi:hypothetical protein